MTERHFDSTSCGILWLHWSTWVSITNTDRRACVPLCGAGFIRSTCVLLIFMLHSDWSLKGRFRRSCCSVCLVKLLWNFLLFRSSSCQRRQLSDHILLPQCRIYLHSLRQRVQGLYSSEPPAIRLHLSIAICALASMCLTLFSFFHLALSQGCDTSPQKKSVVESQTDFIGHISHPCRENT